MKRFIAIVCALLLLAPAITGRGAQEPQAAPAAEGRGFDIPGWFKESFLDFPSDLREAAAQNKRLLVYFGQDGCPYCRELMQVNFAQKDIVDKTRASFDAIALSIWGDRDVTWTDGKMRTEKDFAGFLKVQFTPTLLFFDEKGNVVLRLNGYYPPHKFRAALDYVSQKMESRMAFADYLKGAAPEPASGVLHHEPFFIKPPYTLDRSKKTGARPLAVVFEQAQCSACDEMHAKGFKQAEAGALLAKFDVVRLALFGNEPVITPAGKKMTAAQWGRALNVAYTPSIVFFDRKGVEVFRIEAYLKPFHLASSLEYVASSAYREEPNFQRFIQARAERKRAKGEKVDLWK